MTSTQDQLKKAQREADRRKLRDALMLRLRANKIRSPIFEYQFDPNRGWLADMAWPRDRLLVELHGGLYQRRDQKTGKMVTKPGRHLTPKGFTADREKMNAAQLAGFRILEFTPGMIASGYAENAIATALPECVPLDLGPRLPRQGRRVA